MPAEQRETGAERQRDHEAHQRERLLRQRRAPAQGQHGQRVEPDAEREQQQRTRPDPVARPHVAGTAAQRRVQPVGGFAVGTVGVQHRDVLGAGHLDDPSRPARRRGGRGGVFEEPELEPAVDDEQVRRPALVAAERDRDGGRDARVARGVVHDGGGAHRVPDEPDPVAVDIGTAAQIADGRREVPL
jgi:hypothetical protein